MAWRRRQRRTDQEIAPDEIFLDASNAPAFDRARFEGRLEQPLARSAYLGAASVIGVLFVLLLSQAWNLEFIQGNVFAQMSARNTLAKQTLFAERGTIVDTEGVPLVTNEATGSGFVKRVYKTPGFASILGYVSYPKKDSKGNYYDTELKGLAGVEATFNDTLAGTDGSLLVEEDAVGTVVSQGTLIAPIHGATLTLSIDSRAQTALFTAIQELADRVPYVGGSGILMDANTGEVRALVSYPEYDPNVLSEGSPSSVIAGYAKDTRHPYIDRAVQGSYTPGSVVKPIEASGALEDGIVTPDYTVNATGSLSLPNPYDPARPNIFLDWKSFGVIDLRQAIAFSSDVYFYIMGGGYKDKKGLGIDRLGYWFKTFGLTSKTGIELPRESAGLVPTPAWKQATFGEAWNIGNTYHTAIGQYGMQVTPIEMARAIAAIANGGTLVKPTLVNGAKPEGATVPVDAAVLQVVREGMRLGVTEGTSIGLSDLSYVHAAGKTGTAQLGYRNEFHNSWAVGFFPYDKPKYVYVVVMERGPATNSIGGIYVMHQVFSALHQSAPEYFK